jgi:hypothetical protein
MTLKVSDQAATLARLTDSTPPLAEVLTICAWCPDFEPLHPRNKGASHGLCTSCRELMEREIA